MSDYKIIEDEENNDVFLYINQQEYASWNLSAYRKHQLDIIYQMMACVAEYAKQDGKREMRKALGL